MIPDQQAPQPSAPSSSEPINIVIADDHVLFSDGLKRLLEADQRLHVLAAITDGDQVLRALAMHKPDLLLLDINLPGTDGMELAATVRQRFGSMKIIFLTMYSEQGFIDKAHKLGVEGYLLKSSTQQELLRAVYAVMEGGKAYAVRKEEGKLHEQDAFLKKYKLTPREQQIVRMIVRGQSSQDIANELYLSLLTVETHRRNINLKLGIHNPAELVKLAMEIGLS